MSTILTLCSGTSHIFQSVLFVCKDEAVYLLLFSFTQCETRGTPYFIQGAAPPSIWVPRSADRQKEKLSSQTGQLNCERER